MVHMTNRKIDKTMLSDLLNLLSTNSIAIKLPDADFAKELSNVAISPAGHAYAALLFCLTRGNESDRFGDIFGNGKRSGSKQRYPVEDIRFLDKQFAVYAHRRSRIPFLLANI